MIQEKFKKELILILEDELTLHKEMLSVLDEEREQLMKKPGDIMPVLEKKELLLEEIKKKESSRQELVVRIANLLNIQVKDITAFFLAKIWEEPRLLELKKETKAVLEEIKKRQRLNSGLIQQGLELIERCVNTLTSGPQESLYGPKGNIKEPTAKRYRFLDKKI